MGQFSIPGVGQFSTAGNNNPYRIKAYKKAARTIETFPTEIITLLDNGTDLTTIPNIGKTIDSHIHEIINTGKIPKIFHRKPKANFRNELKDIFGIGKKRMTMLETQMGIRTRSQLLYAIKSKKLKIFKWYDTKLENKIIESLLHPKPYERFLKYKTAELIINHLQEKIELFANVDYFFSTSSFRRKNELIGNVTLLVVSQKPEAVIKQFCDLDIISEIVNRDKNSAIVILRSTMQIKLKIINENKIGSQLLINTGSPEHVEELVKLAKHKNLKLNEKGLFKDKKCIASRTEEEIYQSLELSYIEPELRENRGEINASKAHRLPKLITLDDIKGDLHSHTYETDGTESLETMVNAAINKGYEYLAITDHSKRLAITNGLDEKRLWKQIKLIDKLNSKLKNFTILKSIEVDILEDGTLDLSNDILKELDLCVCSIHSKFKLSENIQTERIIRAMDNPYFTILGHATGRLIASRAPYPLQIEKILLAAKERGCFLELNAQPSRLDIRDEYCLMAKILGVKIAISSDAHSVPEFNLMRFGIYQARRGWLEATDVLNTRNLKELKKMLKRK